MNGRREEIKAWNALGESSANGSSDRGSTPLISTKPPKGGFFISPGFGFFVSPGFGFLYLTTNKYLIYLIK